MGMLIGFTGLAGSGKDTACDYLVDKYPFVKLSFGDALREMALDIDPMVGSLQMGHGIDPLPIHYSQALDMYDYESAKAAFPEMRRFLQRLGNEGVREHFGEDAWSDIVEFHLQAWSCISDVRFQSDASMIARHGGILIRVDRKPSTKHEWKDLSAENQSHTSETEMADIEVDFVLPNHESIEDLHRNLESILQLLGVSHG